MAGYPHIAPPGRPVRLAASCEGSAPGNSVVGACAGPHPHRMPTMSSRRGCLARGFQTGLSAFPPPPRPLQERVGASLIVDSVPYQLHRPRLSSRRHSACSGANYLEAVGRSIGRPSGHPTRCRRAGRPAPSEPPPGSSRCPPRSVMTVLWSVLPPHRPSWHAARLCRRSAWRALRSPAARGTARVPPQPPHAFSGMPGVGSDV